MVRILSRYIAREFFKAFAFGLVLFSLVIFLADFFDNLNMLLSRHAPAGIMLEYLGLRVPYWAVRIIPVATLLATLVAIGRMIQTGEWMAMESSGFGALELLAPLILASFVVAGFSFLAQETVVPSCALRVGRLYRERIRRDPASPETLRRDVVLGAGPDTFVTVHVFDAGKGSMDRAVADFFSSGRLARQLDAMGAVWDARSRTWIFRDGVERVFSEPERSGQAEVREKIFKKIGSGIRIPPSNLMPDEKTPDEMSSRALLRRIRNLSRIGFSRRQEWVALYQKLAYPFANVVMCLLGIPFAFRLRGGSRVLNFGCALAMAFLYWWVISLGQTLGQASWFPAFLAAWLANLSFGGIGAYLLFRT